MKRSKRNLAAALTASTLLAGIASAEPVAEDRLAAALVALDAMAAKSIADGAVPGLAIAVVHDDKVAFLKGHGLREAGRPETVGVDTVFQLASFSKPISSTVVAAMVGKDLVDWDSRIAELAPDYRLRDAYPSQQVTVRDLFSHRSGLPGSAGNDLEDIGYDRETVMHRLALVPPSSSFRAGYAYSNAGITMGALAAARPSGLDWETAAEEFVFKPLGMSSTSYRYSDFEARADAARLHVRVGDAWTALVKRDADAQAPAGGASSSARDLAQWMRLELGRGVHDGAPLIPPEAIAETHEPVMARGPDPIHGNPTFYGLGWAIEYTPRGVKWGHAGAFSNGARTLVSLYPDSGLGIVVLANAFPTGAPEGLADSFFDLVFEGEVARDYFTPWDALYASLFEPAIAEAKRTFAAPPEPASPARPDAAYVGTYAGAYAGTATLTAEAGALTLAVGPEGRTRYPLTHFDRDIFLNYPSPEMPEMPGVVRFTLGPDGTAVSITIDSLDANGLGTLTRVE